MWGQLAGATMGSGSSVSAESGADQGGDSWRNTYSVDAMSINRGSQYLPLALVGLAAVGLLLYFK